MSDLMTGGHAAWAVALVFTAALFSAGSAWADSPWKNGPPDDPAFFPIAVWLQSPDNAARYRQAGINVYVALWQGPTEKQLATLKAAGMSVICDQNEVGLKHIEDPTIIAWMHGDEPDNAQSLGKGKGYGPPILPQKIEADYQMIRRRDPSRPVMLNLGQGVAWDQWHGRGVRTNHPEDYPLYLRGCDIVSFDIYPVAHDNKQVRGKLEYVGQGVERLVKWADGKKIVWNCIECTYISADQKATPQQVKTEVWMSLIHGSRGLVHFVHQFKPKFNEHALLDDAPMLDAVTRINQQIHELAPVLNSPDAGAAKVQTSNSAGRVDAMIRQHGGATYLFAVAMNDTPTDATFTLPAGATATTNATVEVIGEDRNLKIDGDKFTDSFAGYAVHLYRIH